MKRSAGGSRAGKSDAPAGKVRLQKYLSDAGVASRRHAEEMILEGRVAVNGDVVDTLPAFVHPGRDRVSVGGNVVRAHRKVYFLVHKPPGVHCSEHAPPGKKTVGDLLPPMHERVRPVGALEPEASGVVLMTNDGELFQQLSHPRYSVSKTYEVEVRGRVDEALRDKLLAGAYLAEGKAKANAVEVVHAGSQSSTLRIQLTHALPRHIPRLLAKFGYVAKQLHRTEFATLTIKGLAPAAARELTAAEIKRLAHGLSAPRPGPAGRKRRTRGGVSPRDAFGAPAKERENRVQKRNLGSGDSRSSRSGAARRIIGDQAAPS